MPWKLKPKDGEILVVNSKTGKIMGRHKSRGKARRQLAALYANEPGAGKALFTNITISIRKRLAEFKK